MSGLAGTFRATVPAGMVEVHEATWTVVERHLDPLTEATMVRLLTAALRGIQELDPDATLELQRPGQPVEVVT